MKRALQGAAICTKRPLLPKASLRDVRKHVGCERGADLSAILCGGGVCAFGRRSEEQKHTPLTFPLPNTQAFTQRGLSVLVKSNDATIVGHYQKAD